ncbi:MAG: flagellar filament capping protein FliD, partial [Candidatus Desulforudaceae bacterium]
MGNAVEVGGTNAVLNINGLDIVRATNEFTVNDVNFTPKGSGTATVTVRGDTESVFQSIKAFIDGYNSLLDQFNGKLQEKRFQDYLPLLEDDPARENLTEKQIDQWQEKARSGLLRGDSILDSIVTRLRNDVFSSVSGLDPSLNHLTQIGIKIGSREERGKLVIDEAKLRAAIEQDPEGVARIF